MILYEDSAIIVCHKRAGIPVQSASLGQKDMVSILNNHLAEKTAGRLKEPIHIVHRLDQPVEGILVFAKTKRAAAGLGRQIAEGKMEKIYQAVSCVTADARKKYHLQPEETFTLVDYLSKNAKTNTSSIVRQSDKNARRAELTFRILDVYADGNHIPLYILSEIQLKTGRHHQIRVQMANAGLPLYGDCKYNLCRQEASEGRSSFPALCATSLCFVHPVTGRLMKFKSEPQTEIFQMWDGRKE